MELGVRGTTFNFFNIIQEFVRRFESASEESGEVSDYSASSTFQRANKTRRRRRRTGATKAGAELIGRRTSATMPSTWVNSKLFCSPAKVVMKISHKK